MELGRRQAGDEAGAEPAVHRPPVIFAPPGVGPPAVVVATRTTAIFKVWVYHFRARASYHKAKRVEPVRAGLDGERLIPGPICLVRPRAIGCFVPSGRARWTVGALRSVCLAGERCDIHCDLSGISGLPLPVIGPPLAVPLRQTSPQHAHKQTSACCRTEDISANCFTPAIASGGNSPRCGT